MDDKPTLKPCPFCGERPEIDMNRPFRLASSGEPSHKGGVSIACSTCGCEIMNCREDLTGSTDEEILAITVENWNQRPKVSTDDRIRAALILCQCAIQGYKDTHHLHEESVLNKALAAAGDALDSEPKEIRESPAYLIWSIEHNAWWGPHRKGYTPMRSYAGRYTFDEAREIVSNANQCAHPGRPPMEAMIEEPEE